MKLSKVKETEFFSFDSANLNNCSIVKPTKETLSTSVFSNTVKAWQCNESLTRSELSRYLKIELLNKTKLAVYSYNDKLHKLEPTKSKFNRHDWIIYDSSNNHIVKLTDSQFCKMFDYQLDYNDRVSISALSKAISNSYNENSLNYSSMW